MDVLLFGAIAAGAAYLWGTRETSADEVVTDPSKPPVECPEGMVWSCDGTGQCGCATPEMKDRQSKPPRRARPTKGIKSRKEPESAFKRLHGLGRFGGLRVREE